MKFCESIVYGERGSPGVGTVRSKTFRKTDYNFAWAFTLTVFKIYVFAPI